MKPKVTRLHCAGVIGPRGTAIEDADAILIRDGAITAVGSYRQISARAPEAEPLDHSDSYAVGGLVNAHDHLLFRRSRLSMARHFAQPCDLQLAFGLASMLRSLAEGVTAVRDMGAPRDLAGKIAQVAGSRAFPAPAVATCLKPITVPNGPGLALSLAVESEAEGREAVARMADQGAKFVKVFASTDGADTRQPVLSEDILAAVCRAAERRQLMVVAHATTRPSIMACLRAGVRCIEHGVELDAPAAAQMVQVGAWFVPTLSGFAEIACRGSAWGRPPHVVSYFSSLLETHRRAFEYALESGVRYAVGTDSLGTMAMEMRMMLDYGASLEQVMRAATVNGAELLGISASHGLMAAGAPADLALLPSDPSGSPIALARPTAAMRGGVLYQTDELGNLLNSQFATVADEWPIA